MILEDEEFKIRGKPDEIWRLTDGTYLVVEHKSSVLKTRDPYLGDRLQLAAYLLLTEKIFQARHITGEIRYRNRTVKLEWNPVLKKQLTQVIRQMRLVEEMQETEANVYVPKCLKCEFYKISCNKN